MLTVGLRRSPSIKSTFLPCCAKATAILALAVDLPAAASEDVTRKLLIP